MKERSQRVEALLAAALTLPPAERAAFLRRESAGDEELARQVQSRLAEAQLRGASGAALPAGMRIGAYRIVESVAQRGVGEVYRAERADGQFQQRVALRLIARDAAAPPDRFEDECRSLAQLEHPGIARVFEGGIAPDGRPYVATEWVDGPAVTRWCARHKADLRARLELFLQACDAVAYAHRNLALHQDLRSANVRVTLEGRAKLLDFGLAGLVPGDRAAVARPPATTASDCHALGVLLYELLTGERPPADAPAASAVAARAGHPPVAPRRLAGDLDAIIAKALHREPAARYETVTALQADLQRYLAGQPVAARGGGRAYVLGRFLLRHRWAVAATALLALALTAVLGSALWQARRAQAQARHDQAIQGFLEGVFRVSDPRSLDANVARIATEFADQPDVQIELLGRCATLYRQLGDEARYHELRGRQVELARRWYGGTHPTLIEGLLDDARYANEHGDDDGARQRLAQAQVLIDAAGLQRSALQARWYLVRSEVVYAEGAAGAIAAVDALRQAAALYAEVAPDDPDYVKVLASQGFGALAADPAAAERYYSQALDLAARSGARADMALQQALWPGLATARESQGDHAGALDAYRNGAELARRVRGEAQGAGAAAEYAWALHRQGLRAQALERFERLLRVGAADPAREQYASCLAAEGRAELAIPLLEAGPRGNRLVLGDAYDRVGREDDARRVLEGSLAERVAKELSDGAEVRAARERWARFLLDQHDLNAAEEEFSAIVLAEKGRKAVGFALAHGGLARVALAHGDADAAMRQSQLALDIFGRVTGRRDVRVGPYLWLVRSAALRQAGDFSAARDFAQRALDASRSYDDPNAPSIGEAQVALANAEIDLGNLARAHDLASAARVVYAAHPRLPDHDTAPLRRLDERLAKAG